MVIVYVTMVTAGGHSLSAGDSVSINSGGLEGNSWGKNDCGGDSLNNWDWDPWGGDSLLVGDGLSNWGESNSLGVGDDCGNGLDMAFDGGSLSDGLSDLEGVDGDCLFDSINSDSADTSHDWVGGDAADFACFRCFRFAASIVLVVIVHIHNFLSIA